MKQINLLTAIFIAASIALAFHSYHNEYVNQPPTGRWIRTVIYGLGPWLCAFAFTGAKVCFQNLMRKEISYGNTFKWVTGVVIGLMIFTKFMAK
ncbi:MAG: hypothetical protein HOK21_17260 [Rhodospirillaceae bacterium]|jgi:hypothetical protein|nr:hypothetical protein [Rhodospirillaceae bacterium]MBT4046630.1 hypothetical protein [Rhodospirillaceae bacterium]MBT4689286.1 hypothetical protein [Rhodospirillaceae bacterium]MBT5079359.1 hypothetical protein [Rhodospirillaceae bacterium]MBT5525834.1 hypothetical protein [Rhodospirillaceae bacterium]